MLTLFKFVSSNFNKPQEEKKAPSIKPSEYDHADFGDVEIIDIPIPFSTLGRLADATYLLQPGLLYLRIP